MTKVTLFHANWCGHCKSFMPTWQALKKIFKENNIEFAEYEDEKDEDAIKSNNIDGFPTIKIHKDGELASESKDFNCDPSLENFNRFIKDSI